MCLFVVCLFVYVFFVVCLFVYVFVCCMFVLQSVISIHPESVDGHFYLGKYYDRLKFVFASDRPTKSA